MCDICRLVSDDDNIDGGLFITSQPPCPKGRELAVVHHIRISRLPLYAPDADEEASMDNLSQ